MNYGILKSIIFHALWNSIMLGAMLYNLQFPDENLNRYEDSELIVEWKRTPKFNDNEWQIKSFYNDSLIAKNVEAIYLFDYLNNYQKLDSLNNFRILQSENYMRYNFRMSSKLEDEQKFEENMKQFLVEENLIYLLEK